MARAASDVMQSIIFSAVLDGIAALKRSSGGLPNQLLRDVQAIHPNVTFADLPKELQDAIGETTRAAPADSAVAADGPSAGPRPARTAARSRAGSSQGRTSAERRGTRQAARRSWRESPAQT
jgi:hypothetical protein